MVYSKYWFWLIVLALIVIILERLFPWRKEQKLFRPQLLQDIFRIIFNGYLFGRFFGFTIEYTNRFLSAGFENVTGSSVYMGPYEQFPFCY